MCGIIIFLIQSNGIFLKTSTKSKGQENSLEYDCFFQANITFIHIKYVFFKIKFFKKKPSRPFNEKYNLMENYHTYKDIILYRSWHSSITLGALIVDLSVINTSTPLLPILGWYGEDFHECSIVLYFFKKSRKYFQKKITCKKKETW